MAVTRLRLQENDVEDAEKARIVWPVSIKSSQPTFLLQPLLKLLELCNKLDFIFDWIFCKYITGICTKKNEDAICKGI